MSSIEIEPFKDDGGSIMIQAVAVEHLCEGLFVVELEGSQGRVPVNQSGRINSGDLIEKIKATDVKKAWVDFNQSDLSHYVPGYNKLDPKPAKTVSLDVERKRAESILIKSKVLLGKVFDGLYQGKNIGLAPIAKLSESIVESICCNPDAIHCVSALRKKETYLLEHSLNVAYLMVTFGRYLGLNQHVLKQLAIGGLLHDVGKTQVRTEIVNKPARLSSEELEHMKLHQVFSEPILDSIPGLSKMSRQVSLLHHEKLDGSGYPRGLAGDEISLIGRMSAIVDIYDALTAPRCYKESMSSAAAFNILKSMTPHQLDSDLLNEFIRSIGIYPVGSLVELSDGRAGLVWESNETSLLRPVVKCFYSIKFHHYVEVETVKLAENKMLTIERGLSAGKTNIDLTPYC